MTDTTTHQSSTRKWDKAKKSKCDDIPYTLSDFRIGFMCEVADCPNAAIFDISEGVYCIHHMKHKKVE